ncbi:MAG: EamA family transporter [Chloroflexota bacterium]
MDRTQRDGLLLLLVAAAGYAFFPILTKNLFASGQLQPLDVLFLRFLIATPITWLVIGWQKRRATKNRRPETKKTLPRWRLIGMGVIFSMTAASAFVALTRLPASTYTVILYSYPAMVAILSLFLGERLAARGWLALALTVVGIILTVPDFRAGLGDGLGIIFALLNAGIYATYIVLSGRLLRGHSNLAQASAWSITGTFLTMIVVSIFRGVNWPTEGSQWLSLIAMAVISTVIPIFAFYSGMQKLGAARAAILSTIEPVFTLMLAFLLLGERILTIQIVGAALILSSVILLQLGRREQPVVEVETQTEAVG